MLTRFRRPPPMREVIKGWFTMRERPVEQAVPDAFLLAWADPMAVSFDPIFSAWHRAGLVAVAPTAVGLLSVSVEDQSSTQSPPNRLWSFPDRNQAKDLQQALGEWLARSELNGV